MARVGEVEQTILASCNITSQAKKSSFVRSYRFASRDYVSILAPTEVADPYCCIKLHRRPRLRVNIRARRSGRVSRINLPALICREPSRHDLLGQAVPRQRPLSCRSRDCGGGQRPSAPSPSSLKQQLRPVAWSSPGRSSWRRGPVRRPTWWSTRSSSRSRAVSRGIAGVTQVVARRLGRAWPADPGGVRVRQPRHRRGHRPDAAGDLADRRAAAHSTVDPQVIAGSTDDIPVVVLAASGGG